MIVCEISLSAADIVAIVSMIVTLILGTKVVTIQNRNRTQRDFFIKEIDSLKSDYFAFIDDIRAGNLSSSQIGNGFSNFSSRITMLDEVIESEYHISHNDVFKKHGEFQILVTELKSLEDQFNQDSVKLTNDDQITMMSNFQPISRSMINLIVEINKAPIIQPWERNDFYNY